MSSNFFTALIYIHLFIVTSSTTSTSEGACSHLIYQMMQDNQASDLQVS